MGHCVANAGDVNGDGWSDVLFGMPGYSDTFTRQGLCRLYRGGGGTAVFQLSYAFRFSGGIVQPLSLTDPNLVGLGMTGRSAAGRTRVRLEWRVKPPVGLATPSLSGLGNFTLTGAPGPYGSLAGLIAGENRLATGFPYSWQLRTRSRSAYFPASIWVSPETSAPLEWDMRAPGSFVDVAETPRVSGLALAAARPNPMRTSAAIEYGLTREGQVTLAIVDVQGRRVRELAQGVLPAGPHRVVWDGRTDDGIEAAAGVYFILLEAEKRVLSRKLALVR
jgi:hypothetical protein